MYLEGFLSDLSMIDTWPALMTELSMRLLNGNPIILPPPLRLYSGIEYI